MEEKEGEDIGADIICERNRVMCMKNRGFVIIRSGMCNS